MPRQIPRVPLVQAIDLQGFVKVQALPCFQGEQIRHDDQPIVFDRDETQVECGVEMGRQQNPVVYIESFGICFAMGPRLNMARSEQLAHGESRYGAAAAPIIEQCCPKQVLADALDNEPFDLGRLRQ